jgi:hypothetical protein
LADQFAANNFRRIAELLHSASPQDIDRLVASSGLDKLAKLIISVWYSGLLGTGETTRVLVSAALDADVVIIGSGVAGSLIAWRLAEAKLKILILETGPRIDCVEAFKSYLSRDVYAWCRWLDLALGGLGAALQAE